MNSHLFAFIARQILSKNYNTIAIRNINSCKLVITSSCTYSTNQDNRSTKEMDVKNSQKMFNFNNYDCIGMDLDNTVVKYKVAEMIKLEYEVLAEFLIAKGYSKENLSRPIEEDYDFMQKGLILDFARGNLLRTCPSGEIQIACHGTKVMTKTEIVEIYGEHSRWEVTDEYCQDMLVAWNGTLAEQIRTCLDYFDMPAALAFARIVDSIDKEKGGRQREYKIWPDILEGLIAMYTRDFFDTNESKYFIGLKADPPKFVYKADESVLKWLKELKAKKTTFLVTGSHIDFANFTATTALGANWREYFDFIICFAKKPGFFTQKRQFMQLDGIKETEPLAEGAPLEKGVIYTQGNFKDLKSNIAALCKKDDPKIVYIGDNLIQDVYTPNKSWKSDTVAIVEEMLAEGPDYDADYAILRSKLWGSYFHTEGDDTLWEKIIRRHSKICVPGIDELAKHPVDHNYTCFDVNDQTSNGYHPHDPSRK